MKKYSAKATFAFHKFKSINIYKLGKGVESFSPTMFQDKKF